MFIDRITIQCLAGKGGNGIVAWRREKYIPKGGPSGGNGGRGGSIIFVADHNVMSLEAFSNRSIIRAENGVSGASGCKNGRHGQDVLLQVPCGTLIKDADSQEILYDLTLPGDTFTICQGGRGGRGNFSFRTSTNRAPNIATSGKAGEAKNVELELKIIADVGLVGLPNSGKSTLISSLANLQVKVAPYPFTTLQPNVGFIFGAQGERVLLADIPGIIQGAHNNKGLGYEFLRHIERTKMLLFVIDIAGTEGRDPLDDFAVLRYELENYDPDLLKKPFLICLNKIDISEAAIHVERFKETYPMYAETTLLVSAFTGQGLEALHHTLTAQC